MAGRRKRVLEPALPVELAGAVRRARRAEGVSQSELARRLECSQQYVSKIERGVVVFTPACVATIAAALGVPVGRIYGEEKP